MTTPLRPVPSPDPSEPLLRELLGDVLRHKRAERGRTLRDVADDAQVSLAYVSEVERGQKEASSEILGAVCRALDITLLDLISTASGELDVRRETTTMPHSASATVPTSGGATLALVA